jgi:hypothetical protein
MEKLVRYGLLLIVLLLFVLSLFIISTQTVFAYSEEAVEDVTFAVEEQQYSPQDKANAIHAAADAILNLPPLNFIISAEQHDVIAAVARARALVDSAMETYNLHESSFYNLDKLTAAENKVAKLLAIKAAKDAIDAIPPLPDLIEQDRELIERARMLVDVAMQQHGATYFEICWRYDALKAAEVKIDDLDEPEPLPEPIPQPVPPDEPVPPNGPLPTPPTGGLTATIIAGLLLSGAGLLFMRKKRGTF